MKKTHCKDLDNIQIGDKSDFFPGGFSKSSDLIGPEDIESLI